MPLILDVLVVGSVPRFCRRRHSELEQNGARCLVEYRRSRLSDVAAGAKLAAGEFSAGMAALEAGRLGSVQVQGSQIILGPPLMFTKGNIDQFDF